MASKSTLVDKSDALPGRSVAIQPKHPHVALGSNMLGPFDSELQTVAFGMGCFWGAERLFWRLEGVHCTAVGYAAGFTPNPTYEEVCSGLTAHAEVVLVVFNPEIISLDALLRVFWESHDPTQGMRQGNDRGTQYRSCILYSGPGDEALCKRSREQYQERLNASDMGQITTDIEPLQAFYYAEEYHQQYLAKNPQGYCGIGGCGVKFDNDV